MRRTGFPLFLFPLAILLISGPGHAENEPARHSPIMPVKIKPVQEGADGVSKAAPDIERQSETVDPDTLALYGTQAEGSLGPDLWNGVSRKNVIGGMEKLPVPRFSPRQRDLALRVILTKAPVESPSKPDSALFAARMTKLVEFGAYKEAMSLYEKLDNPEVPAVSLAGMKAFTGSGQIAIACLEQKALDSALKSDDPFWRHLDLFCRNFIKVAEEGGDASRNLMRAALAYAETEKTESPAQFEDLNHKTLVELLVMAKSGMLDRGNWSVATVSGLSPSVVSFLLALHPSDPDQKLSLMTVAVASGIKTPEDLDAAYKELAVSGEAYQAWTPILNGYSRLAAAPAADRTQILKSLLASFDIFSASALTPFVPFLTDIQPAAPFTAAEARSVLKILIAANAPIPVSWVNLAYGTDFTDISGESALIEIWNHTSSESGDQGSKPSAQAKGPKPPVSKELAYSLILNEFFNKEDDASEVQKIDYEKLLNLTEFDNYVMPSSDITGNLKKASQAKSLGGILLYGLQILGGTQTDRIHPAALSQVLKTFKTAGLSEETVSLAHEALAGLIEEKKEN